MAIINDAQQNFSFGSDFFWFPDIIIEQVVSFR